MSPRRWLLTAGLGVGAVTLRRMIVEFRRDGALSVATAGVLDALYLAHAAAVTTASRRDHSVLQVPQPVAAALGIATVACGVGVMAAGMRQFPSVGQVNAIGDREFVTAGIYRYTRNPQYLGWSLVLAGVGLAHRSWRGMTLAAVYPAAIQVWLPHEERHLEDEFGLAYRRYRRRVRRWIGYHTDEQEVTHG